MANILSLGSQGSDVVRLERRLTELALYTGNPDGAYGGGVESAVRTFQKLQGLPPDGVVGPETWAALFQGQGRADVPPVNPLASAPILDRCVALTGAFETSAGVPDCYAGLCGDFDGQGMSLGVAQWNIGQGTLQPMLLEMISKHSDVTEGVFHDRLPEIQRWLALTRQAQLEWVRAIQDPVRHNIFEPWKGLFRALARTPEFQAIQVEHAAAMQTAALALCSRFGVTTERAVALMFDIQVQNGSIGPATEQKIRADFAALQPGMAPLDLEVAKLRSIANRRAEAANPRFIEDVRTRKLAIANGRGAVHGVPYDLETQFCIGLRNAHVDGCAGGRAVITCGQL